MKILSRLAQLLSIKPGEGQLVSLLLLQYILFGVSSVFSQTTAFSLFLTEFDGQTLAYAYLLNSVVIASTTYVLLRLSNRFSFARVLVINQTFQLVLTIAYWVGLSAGGTRWVVFLLPMLFQTLINMGNIAFWSLAGRLFDVRQSKRLFGVVGAGQWISIVAFGFVMSPIVAVLGTSNLLLLAVAGLACALALIIYTTRRYASKLAAPATEPATAQRPAPTLGALLRNRYVALILLLVFVWWLTFFFLDNLFYRLAALQYPDANQLASFLGAFLALLGILTLLSNFLIAGPLISRLGLRTTLMILPVALFVGTLAMAVLGALGATVVFVFGLTVLTKLLDMSVGLSFDKTAQTILFQPLPANERPRLYAIADGLIQPASIFTTGVALIILNALFPASTLPLIFTLVGIVAVWVVIAALLGRDYSGMLLQALKRRSLSGVNVPVADASCVGILTRSLQDPHPGIALYAANTLEEVAPGFYAARLPGLLSHPSEQVRQEALRRIEQQHLTLAMPALKQRLDVEQSSEMRAVIWRTMTILGDANAQAHLRARINDPDRWVQQAAISGLMRSDNASAAHLASQQLINMAESEESTSRIMAARLVGEVGLQRFLPQMRALLQDRVPAVQRAALRVAGQIKYPALWSMVLQALHMPGARKAAMAALVEGGDAALAEVIRAFGSDGQANQTLLADLAQVCGRMGGDSAVAILKAQLASPSVAVRSQVVRALIRCGYRAEGDAAARIKAQVKTELSHAAWLLTAIDSMGTNPAVYLLQSALREQLGRCSERIFYLLACVYDAPVILRARENLLYGAADKQAYALELLDTQLERELKGDCFALIEDLTPSQRLRRLSAYALLRELTRAQWLQELSSPSERVTEWVAECARYTIDAISGAFERADRGGKAMLSLIEKVIILKKVPIFTGTPDDVLADVARVLDEVEYSAGQKIIEKGDAGDSMYLIASGRVRAHDGDSTLNILIEGQQFGETALLDPGPRTASVTALEDTRLLRLDQATLYELMEDRPEVSRGIIRVLSRFLRERLDDLSELRKQQNGVTIP